MPKWQNDKLVPLPSLSPTPAPDQDLALAPHPEQDLVPSEVDRSPSKSLVTITATTITTSTTASVTLATFDASADRAMEQIMVKPPPSLYIVVQKNNDRNDLLSGHKSPGDIFKEAVLFSILPNVSSAVVRPGRRASLYVGDLEWEFPRKCACAFVRSRVCVRGGEYAYMCVSL